jgi:hypothetical protein
LTEERNSTNIIKSSEISSETVMLDPNVSIIPGKSKPDPNMMAYFNKDELEKEKKIADEKLNLRGGPVVIDNIITNISKDDIEEPPEEPEEEITKSKVVKSLPPPPPPKPVGRGRDIPVKKTPEPKPDESEEGSGMKQTIILLIIILVFLYFYFKKN